MLDMLDSFQLFSCFPVEMIAILCLSKHSASGTPPADRVLSFSLQAPIELLLGRSWARSCRHEPGLRSGCGPPHLLGLCKILTWMDHTAVNFVWGSSVCADVLLWAALRLQLQLMATQLYAKVGGCFCSGFLRNSLCDHGL